MFKPSAQGRKILVTGANGFVGRRLLSELPKAGFHVRAAVRKPVVLTSPVAQSVIIEDLSDTKDWAGALSGVDLVVHLAARVHVMEDKSADPMNQFSEVNVDATLRLALQAAVAGVRRFVFLSSIKVNGEQTEATHPFRADDAVAPHGAYAISKYQAEKGLSEISAATGLEVVIIRPPLIYGPGVKANFAALVRAVARGLPLPLGAIDNRRSLVGIDNLVDLIITCTTHAAAAGQTFLVSDGEDVSTADLVRGIGAAMGRPARLLPVPVWAIKAGAAALGRSAAAERLCGNLQVDMSATCERLCWRPPVSLDEGLRRAVAVEAVR